MRFFSHRVIYSLGAVPVALLLSGCGSSSPSAASTSSTTTSSVVASISSYRQCLSKHGVNLSTFSGARSRGGFGRGFGGGFGSGSAPLSGSSSSSSTTTPSSPTSGPSTSASQPTSSSVPKFLPPGVTAQQFHAARRACASLRPTGALRGSGGNTQVRQKMFASYASCMSTNGYPIPSTLSKALKAVTPQDRQSTAYINANNVCKSILHPPSATTSTSSTTS